MLCAAGAVGGGAEHSGGKGSAGRGLDVVPQPFEENLYAQLLMRAVTGSLYPSDTYDAHFVSEDFPKKPYDFEQRKYGKDCPAIGHTMVGWVRLQSLYNALRTCIIEGVRGDFLEAGVWRGGASIFAAGVLREMGCLGVQAASKSSAQADARAGCGMDVWVCDSFQGFETEPWDGDYDFIKLNPIVAVSEETVRANFELYQLGAFVDTSVHFVKGFFADSLPHLHQVSSIAVLRLDGDLFSSTSDILYNLYNKVAIGGFVIVDDYEISDCKRAIDHFRELHEIRDPLIEVDPHSKAVYWRKSAEVEIIWDVYHRYTFVRIPPPPEGKSELARVMIDQKDSDRKLPLVIYHLIDDQHGVESDVDRFMEHFNIEGVKYQLLQLAYSNLKERAITPLPPPPPPPPPPLPPSPPRTFPPMPQPPQLPAATLDQVRITQAGTNYRQYRDSCQGGDSGGGKGEGVREGEGEGYVFISYPLGLNRVVLGLDGDDSISGEGQRTYRIELVSGPAAVAGELRWWVEALADEARLYQTELPLNDGQQAGIVSRWVSLEACSSRVFSQNVWLVSTMDRVPFRTHAVFSWRWGSHMQQVSTQGVGVPLRLNSISSGWGTPQDAHSTGERGGDDNWDGREGGGGDVGMCPDGLTLVTAAVDLMHTWQAPQRHWSAYVNGVRRLMRLRCPLVVFVDSAKVALLQGDAHMHDKVKLVPFDVADIHAAAEAAFGEGFVEHLPLLRSQSWKKRSWNWAKVAESPEYLTLVILKPLLFARATAHVPVGGRTAAGGEEEGGEDLFVWVDSVMDCLTLLRPPLSAETVRSRASNGRVFATAYAGVGTICIGKNA